MHAADFLKSALFVLGSVSVLYTVLAAASVRRFFALSKTSPEAASAGQEGVTLLKPLHQAEPGLRRCLESFFVQGDAQPLRIVFGAEHPQDPALHVARAVSAGHPDTAVLIESSSDRHGYNGKISNIINMMAQERAAGGPFPILVLSDSDICVGQDYLLAIRTALSDPAVGVVSCPYFGRAEAGFWSRLVAMGVSYQFLPNVVAGVSLGLAHPCMGSTIALRRSTLERIGGFEPFRNDLADDYAIGQAVRALGLKSVVAPVLVSHGCSEASFGQALAHELRWARTVLGVEPAGYLGAVIAHPLALALVSLLAQRSPPTLALLAAALGARLWLMASVDRVTGQPLARWWMLPLRDLASFAIFLASFCVDVVEWRGAKFRLSQAGKLQPVSSHAR